MFDYPTILATWERLPDVRLRYAPEETGWAKVLEAPHVCLANVPMTRDRFLYDIWQVSPAKKGFASLTTRVQQYYTQRGSVRYPVSQDEADTVQRFQALQQICRTMACALEGLRLGSALVNLPAHVDVTALSARLKRQGGVLTMEALAE